MPKSFARNDTPKALRAQVWKEQCIGAYVIEAVESIYCEKGVNRLNSHMNIG